MHWEKVTDTGIYYCLCADHALRGICLHILLWLVTKGIITPPPKWSAVRIGGPLSKGRDRHYVDGSALLRDQQSSLHARAKIAKNMQDRRQGLQVRFASAATQQRGLEGPSQEAGQEEEHPEQARYKRGVGRGRVVVVAVDGGVCGS